MKAVAPEVNFPGLEEVVLNNWQEQKTFQAQNEWRKNAKEFSFYDGPPFANGLPHYGHLLANTIKDTVPRYWVMRGYKVNRRFGWDCHGLPVEFEIEKREKLKGRPDILKMGVEAFNEMCRDSVLHYTAEWQKTVTRLGRWVNWDDQYKTMDKSFMESVWWVFSELYKKGLVYQDFKVVPYSPRTSSVVSNFEANQNYKDVQDPAVTVKFKLASEDAYLLVWTTTPWTLPSNLALAVGEEINYVKIKDNETGDVWILAEQRLEALYQKKGQKKSKPSEHYELLSSFLGSELIGKSYEPLFPYFKDTENAFTIAGASYVSTSDGTGIVHQAPAYGEDDYGVCKQLNIALVDPVDDSGCFDAQVSDYQGMYIKDADKNICKDLKQRGMLVKHETIVHSYPFDERTDTPLMYKAVPSWYVAVEEFSNNLVKNNQQINWVPGHIKDGRMGTWLAGARDWAISRNRFWGTPIPVWICDHNKDHVDVMSSVAMLEEKCGKQVDDIHLHFTNKISYACPHCQGTMKPVDVVFDCWFESGSMPYAQLHYPFNNEQGFKENFPADFVAEGLDQTRGWFYTLNVLSNALFEKPAFKNVIVNGVILDESGKKMSKRHRNYTPPDDLLSKYGADSVRLYMLNSPLLRAENLIFTDKGVKDVTRSVLLPLWNAYSFLSTYAQSDQWSPSPELTKGKPIDSKYEHDRWIISKLQTLIGTVHTHMEEYKLYMVVSPVIRFIDDLTNWYIRLNRRRFWGESQKDTQLDESKQSAFSTLFYVLHEFSKVFAPFAPFISESLYLNLTEGIDGRSSSVHLCEMPVVQNDLIDAGLEDRIELISKAINLGRSLRQKHKIKIRQALPSMTIITRKTTDRLAIESGLQTLKGELNIKQVEFTTEESKHVRLSLKPNLRTLGRKLGKKLNEVRQRLNEMNENHEAVSSFLVKLEGEGQVELCGFSLTEEDFLISRGPLDDKLIATGSGVTVLLDTTLSPELVQEGYAREVINRIQNLRKDSKLNVSDRIVIEVTGDDAIVEAVKAHQDYILNETLGVQLQASAAASTSYVHKESYDIDGMSCQIALELNH